MEPNEPQAPQSAPGAPSFRFIRIGAPDEKHKQAFRFGNRFWSQSYVPTELITKNQKLEQVPMFYEPIKYDPYSYRDHVLLFEHEEALHATFLFDEDIYPLIEQSNAGDSYSKYILDTHAEIAYRNVGAQALGNAFTRCLLCGRFLTVGCGGTMLLRPLDCHPKTSCRLCPQICVACCYPSGRQPAAVRQALDILKRVNGR